MYTIAQIVGNLLLSCETTDDCVFNLDDIKSFAAKLDRRDVTWEDVVAACEGKLEHISLLAEGQEVRRASFGGPSFDNLNKNLDDRDKLYIEAMARWFVATRFKGEKQPFMTYVRRAASLATAALDCIR